LPEKSLGWEGLRGESSYIIIEVEGADDTDFVLSLSYEEWPSSERKGIKAGDFLWEGRKRLLGIRKGGPGLFSEALEKSDPDQKREGNFGGGGAGGRRTQRGDQPPFLRERNEAPEGKSHLEREEWGMGRAGRESSREIPQ